MNRESWRCPACGNYGSEHTTEEFEACIRAYVKRDFEKMQEELAKEFFIFQILGVQGWPRGMEGW